MKRLMSVLMVVALLLTSMAGGAAGQEGGFSTDPVATPGFPAGNFGDQRPSVRSVVFASHPGFDRIVFTLTGPATGYRVQYGNRRSTEADVTVLTEGTAVINVVISPVSGGESGTPAPRLNESPGLPQLRQIALLSDFEGNVQYGLAVATVAGFRVVAEGNLLVVDIRVESTLPATGGPLVAPIAVLGLVVLLIGVVLISRGTRPGALPLEGEDHGEPHRGSPSPRPSPGSRSGARY